jgi:hypothetical protein
LFNVANFDVANDVRSSQPWSGTSNRIENLRLLLGPADLTAISSGDAMRLLPGIKSPDRYDVVAATKKSVWLNKFRLSHA